MRNKLNNKLKLLQSIQGFTLIETMVTAGIVGVMSVATSRMMGDLTKSQKGAQQKMEFLSLVNLVSSAAMNDATCNSILVDGSNAVDLSGPNVQKEVTLHVNGSNVGNGSSWGNNLSNIRVYLTAPPNLGTGVVQGLGVNNGKYVAQVGLSITATKVFTAQNLSSSSGGGSLIPITVIVGASAGGVVQSCTGLRLNNTGAFNLPICATGQVVQSNGTQMSCVTPPSLVCSAGSMPNGDLITADSAGSIKSGCVAVPNTCGAAQSFSASASTAGQDAKGNVLSTTLYTQPIPIYQTPGSKTISSYQCGYMSCPAGAVPVYSTQFPNLIVSCKDGEVPSSCIPTTATVSMDKGLITYSGWTCQAPAINTNTGSTVQNYYCSENCAAKAPSVGSNVYFPQLAAPGNNHSLQSCIQAGGRIYMISGSPTQASDVTFTAAAGTLSSTGLISPSPNSYACYLPAKNQSYGCGSNWPQLSNTIGGWLSSGKSSCSWGNGSQIGGLPYCRVNCGNPSTNCGGSATVTTGYFQNGATLIMSGNCLTGNYTSNGTKGTQSDDGWAYYDCNLCGCGGANCSNSCDSGVASTISSTYSNWLCN